MYFIAVLPLCYSDYGLCNCITGHKGVLCFFLSVLPMMLFFLSQMDQYYGDEIINVFESRTLTNQELQVAQKSDQAINKLMEHVMGNTKPDFKAECLRPFRVVFNKLVVVDGVLMKKGPNGAVIVVPEGTCLRRLCQQWRHLGWLK